MVRCASSVPIASSRFKSTAISLAVTLSASVGGIPGCLPTPITDLRKSNMDVFWIEDRSCHRWREYGFMSARLAIREE
jgi:hypothetical protein